MQLLVTGSNGFIGKAYCKEARQRGHEVIPYDLPDCNILDMFTLEKKIRESDMVVHFAAVADLYKSFDNLDVNFEVNIRGTYNIAKLCAEHNKFLIFISTCCVYGNSLDDFETENHAVPRCAEPYATSKVAGEYILHGMPYLKYCILRIGTVYGPGMREALFNYIAIDGISRGEVININGDGTQSRQYIYIDDLVDGMIRATENTAKLNRETVNLCGQEKISVLDTIRIASGILIKEARVNYDPPRYGETQEENISIAKAERLLDWYPRTTYTQGMSQTYALDERFK